MSTGTDLSGAFALLDGRPTRTQGRGPPARHRPTEPADVSPVVSGPEGAHRHRRRWPRVAMAAAAIAALAVGVTLVRSWADGGNTQPGGTATATLPVQSLPFALAPQLDAQVQSLLAAGTGTEVELHDQRRHVHDRCVAIGRAALHDDARPGSGHDQRSSGVLCGRDEADGVLSAPRRIAATAVVSVVAVIWEYAPGAMAQLKPGPPTRIIPPASAPSRDTLLRVAEGIDFQQSTPIRVPFVLAQAPHGMALSSVQVEHHPTVAGTYRSSTHPTATETKSG